MTSIGYPPQLPTPAVPPASPYAIPNVPAGLGVPIAGLSPLNLWAQLGGLVFGCIDQLGIKWHYNDFTGWVDGTSLATATQQRGQAHGTWMGRTWLAARDMTLSGQVQAPTAALAWIARNALLGVVASISSAGYMDVDTQLVVNEPDAQKSAGVRVADKPVITQIDSNVFQFSIPLVARDPRKYGAAQSATLVLPVVSTGLGFPVGPFGGGVTFGGTGTSGTATVSNVGNFPAEPTYTFTGPCTNPFVLNPATGQQLALGIVLGASDVLVASADLSTVVLNGTAYRGNAVLPGSVFLFLPPGNTTLQFGASSYSSLARLTVAWSSAWW